MAAIEKRPRTRQDGSVGPVSYRVRYRAPDGSPRSKTFTRKPDAERYASTVEADLIRAQWRDPRKGTQPLHEWIATWWATDEDVADMRPSTRLRVRGILDRYLLPPALTSPNNPLRAPFHSWPLARLDRDCIKSWVSEMRRSALAPLTVRKIAQTLGDALAGAVEEGLLPASSMTGLKLPTGKTES